MRLNLPEWPLSNRCRQSCLSTMAFFPVCLSDQVHGHVLDCSYISWSVFGSQAHEIVMKDDVERPMPAVFDAPVGAVGVGKKLRIKAQGRQKAPPCDGGFSIAFANCFGHGVAPSMAMPSGRGSAARRGPPFSTRQGSRRG